jgi:hypothetical protein
MTPHAPPSDAPSPDAPPPGAAAPDARPPAAIPYVGLYDVARASRLGLPQARANYKTLERIVSNFGFQRRDELTAKEFWRANAAARAVYGTAFRTWRRNYFRLAAPYRRLLARKTRARELIVLGWEMSPAMKRWLDARDVAYLDVRLSAMRFYDDLLLDLSTNRAWLDREITGRFVRVTRPELMSVAQRAAVDDSEADTLVLVGQVAGDSSLIRADGREMTLSDFSDRIAELSGQYARVLYRPHPKGAPARDPILRDLPRDPEASIYSHMARRASICAISSSALEEAAAFGCPTFRLYEPTWAELHGDTFVREHVHVLRSAQLAGGAFGADGDVPILRFVLGHNASDLRPVREGGSARPAGQGAPAAGEARARALRAGG